MARREGGVAPPQGVFEPLRRAGLYGVVLCGVDAGTMAASDWCGADCVPGDSAVKG